MKSTNMSGPKFEPCGTPELGCINTIESFDMLRTYSFRFLKFYKTEKPDEDIKWIEKLNLIKILWRININDVSRE